jgi:colicin import membrane protein
MKLSWSSTSLSVIGHILLVLALVLFAHPHVLPEAPKAMQAVLMAAPRTVQVEPISSVPTAEPSPEPIAKPKPVPPPTPTLALKPKEKPTPEKKLAPEKPKPDFAAEAKRVTDEAKRIADAAQAKQRAEIQRKQQDVLAQQMQAEVDDLANSAANAALAKQQAAQLREFTLAINKKIKSQWRRPPQISGQLATLLRITLIPGGEVSSVIITKSSGNAAFDASVKDAVLRASPLPIPADAALFRDNFRVFALNYTTEE